MKKVPVAVFLALLIAAIIIFLNNNNPLVKSLASHIQAVFSAPKFLLYGFKSDELAPSNLKLENEKLNKKMADYQKILRDNIALRSQFETASTSEFLLTPAKILGFSGNFLSPESLIIDQGEESGVASGMAVILGNNLIGKVSKTSQKYSQVLLTINPNFKVLAKSSDTNAAGVAQGNADFVLFDKVATKDKISKNSFVLTSGSVDEKGIGIPADLVVGKINSINHSKSLPFQTAKIIPLSNFSKLEMVFVVKGYK